MPEHRHLGGVLEWEGERGRIGLRPGQIAVAVEMLIEHEHLTIQDADVVAAALRAFRGKRSVEFTDCLVLAIAQKAGHSPLGTFDRRLSKLDGAELV